MRNFSIAVGLFALMFVSVVTGARAEGISIAADPNSPDMKVEVNLRDADIVEVLTALFNSTGGKYVVEIGKGVVGRIARLQLPQTPFEEALNAVLGSEFSYTKQQEGDGIYRYRISGSAGTSPSPTTPLGGPALLAPPSNTGGTSKLGSKPASTASGAASLFGAGSLGGSTSGAVSSDEKTATRLIMVSNLDLENLCSELGGSTIFLFTQTSMDSSGGSSGSSGYGGGSGSNRSSRSSGTNSSSGSSNRSSRSSSRSSGGTTNY